MTSLPLEHRRATLANQSRLLVVPMPAVHSTVVSIYVSTGSRFETREDNGVSHFLEHVLYRGTPRHPSAHAQALAFERLGSTLDASTSVDHGVLAVSIPPQNVEPVVALLCATYREPLLQGLEIEKGIVREEILEGLDEHGRLVDADEILRMLCFADHSLGFPIIGTLQQLERFDRTLLQRHHRARYVGAGTVIAAAGPVDFDRLARLLEHELGGVPVGEPPTSDVPGPLSGPCFRYVKHACSQTALRLAYRAPAERDPDEPAMQLLLRLVDDGLSTRLYRRICDELGLCYDVSASYEAYSDCGIVEMGADVTHEHAADVLRAMLGIVRDLREQGPSLEELDRAKARYGWQLEAMLDDPESMADFYALGELTGVGRTPAERHAQLSSVTPMDVQRVAERWLVRQALSVVAVGTLSRAAQDELVACLQDTPHN
ncbi:MAG: insulinase family protein [Polyangiaceae bacterium]|nr:insulinase family protein [Polyangiaceae bacterium]